MARVVLTLVFGALCGMSCKCEKSQESGSSLAHATDVQSVDVPVTDVQIQEDVGAQEEAAAEQEAPCNKIAYEQDDFVWLIQPDSKETKQLVEGYLIGWSCDGKDIFYYTHHASETVVKSFDTSAVSEQMIHSGQDVTARYWRIVAQNASRRRPTAEMRFSFLSGCFGVRWEQDRETPRLIQPSPQNNNQDELTYFCEGSWTHFARIESHCTCFDFAADGRIVFDAWEANQTTPRKGEWNIYITQPGKSAPVKLVSGRSPFFSPDGRYVLYNDGQSAHSLSVVKVDYGEIKPVTNRGAYPSWLSGGVAVLYQTFEPVPGSHWCGGGPPSGVCAGPSWRGRLNIFDLNSGQSQRLRDVFVNQCVSPDYDAYYNASAMSPDGERLAYVATDSGGCGGLLAFLKINSREVTLSRIDWRQSAFLRSILWSPDSSKIVALDLEKAFRVVDVLSGQVVMKVDVPDDYDRLVPPSWAPDSRRLVYGSNSQLFIADTETKTTTALTEGENPLWCPAPQP